MILIGEVRTHRSVGRRKICESISSENERGRRISNRSTIVSNIKIISYAESYYNTHLVTKDW